MVLGSLIDAARAGDEMALARILRRGGAQLNQAVQVPGYYDLPVTPLIASVSEGHTKCMELLIAAGADVNGVCGHHNETPLHVCCAQGRLDIARMLLDAGASLEPSDTLGRSPLLMSCLCDKPACAGLMIEARADLESAMTRHNPGATPLYAAALNGSNCCVSLLCEAGSMIDAKTSDGATPMMVGCQHGHLEVAMLLSSYEASRQTGKFRGFVPKSGTWAEDLARRSGNDELVEWLQESKSFGPLHHIEVLTPQRTLMLLRSGCVSPLAGGSESAAARARDYPTNPSASLIMKASAPWSPQLNELWGRPHRLFAVELLKIGYRLRAKYECALFDVWVAHVMPFAVTWDRGECAEV